MTTWQAPPNFVNGSVVSETELDKLSNDLTYLNHRSLYDKAGSSLVLTNSYQDVPTCSITIDQDGYYTIIAVFDMEHIGSGDDGQRLEGTVNQSGLGDYGETAVFKAIQPYRATVMQQYQTSLTAGTVLTLRAKKSAGSGTSQCNAPNSTITALSSAS